MIKIIDTTQEYVNNITLEYFTYKTKNMPRNTVLFIESEIKGYDQEAQLMTRTIHTVQFGVNNLTIEDFTHKTKDMPLHTVLYVTSDIKGYDQEASTVYYNEKQSALTIK